MTDDQRWIAVGRAFDPKVKLAIVEAMERYAAGEMTYKQLERRVREIAKCPGEQPVNSAS